MCPPLVALARSLVSAPFASPSKTVVPLRLNLRHLSPSLAGVIFSRQFLGSRFPSSARATLAPQCLAFSPLHPYYLLGREHKRTAMNIMSLCNLAAHATHRVVRGCALHRRCIVRFHSPSRGVATVYLGVGSPHLSYNTSEMFNVLDDVFYLRMLARVTHVPRSERAKVTARSRKIRREKVPCVLQWLIWPFRRSESFAHPLWEGNIL
jgi:hypothetical protein